METLCESPNAPLMLRLFGEFEGTVHNKPLPHLRTRKEKWLLALLTLAKGRGVSRAALAQKLWPFPETLESASAHNLRRSLVEVRKALGPEEPRLHAPTREVIAFDLSGADVDIVEFDNALLRGDEVSLRRAIARYRGPLLVHCSEDWILAEREHYLNAYRQALERIAHWASERGDYAEAVRQLYQASHVSPLWEPAQRHLMVALRRSGELPAALEVYRNYLRLLQRDDPRALPSPETTALYQKLRLETQQKVRQAALGVPHSGNRIALASATQEIKTEMPNKLPVVSTPIQQQTTDFEALTCDPVGESEGGAVPLNSRFYIERPTDAAFHEAIARQDSLVLVKGPRQVGKTSLLARGLQMARTQGAAVVTTDLQKFDPEQLETAASLFETFTAMMIDQLDLDVSVESVWEGRRGWNVKFERFLRREVLGRLTVPLVWGLDETDRLFNHSFSTVVFGLFRSWHNERSLNPEGPWHRLTLVIAYATEAHLFITDLNQSPFNVGTRLSLEDFTPAEVQELNRKYGAPLTDREALERFYWLVGGHPYLVRRGLHSLTNQGVDLNRLVSEAALDDGVFGDHLKRMLAALAKDAGLCDAMRAILQGGACPDPASFYRLRSAGLVAGASQQEARPRCGLYRTYLEQHLK